MSVDRVVYLDSSALVKLVVGEPESRELTAFLHARPARVSCALVRVEAVRAVRAHGQAAIRRARQLLEGMTLIRLDDALLGDAAALKGANLRSLDAIHVAAATTLGDELAGIVTYDRRLAGAARELGLRVEAPA